MSHTHHTRSIRALSYAAAGLSSGTLYPILDRLEGRGWLKSRWEDAIPAELGRQLRAPEMALPETTEARPGPLWRQRQLCAVIVIDIAGFTRPDRDDDTRLYLHKELYRILHQAFDDSGIPWADCFREDRGDGALVLMRAAAPHRDRLAATSQDWLVADGSHRICAAEAVWRAERHARAARYARLAMENAERLDGERRMRKVNYLPLTELIAFLGVLAVINGYASTRRAICLQHCAIPRPRPGRPRAPGRPRPGHPLSQQATPAAYWMAIRHAVAAGAVHHEIASRKGTAYARHRRLGRAEQQHQERKALWWHIGAGYGQSDSALCAGLGTRNAANRRLENRRHQPGNPGLRLFGACHLRRRISSCPGVAGGLRTGTAEVLLTAAPVQANVLNPHRADRHAGLAPGRLRLASASPARRYLAPTG